MMGSRPIFARVAMSLRCKKPRRPTPRMPHRPRLNLPPSRPAFRILSRQTQIARPVTRWAVCNLILKITRRSPAQCARTAISLWSPRPLRRQSPRRPQKRPHSADRAPTATAEANAADEAPLIPHPIQEGIPCATCHGLDGLKPYPANHASFAEASCTGCHVAAQDGGAGVVPTATAQATVTRAAASATPRATATRAAASATPRATATQAAADDSEVAPAHPAHADGPG